MTASPLSPVNVNCTVSSGMVGNIFRNVGEILHPSVFNQNQNPSPMPRNKSCGSWARFDPLVKSFSFARKIILLRATPDARICLNLAKENPHIEQTTRQIVLAEQFCVSRVTFHRRGMCKP